MDSLNPADGTRPGRIALIVAVADNGVIGRGGQLPWHLSADLRRFKQLTMGHHVIMGRKTYESIGRALPGRTLIVVSSQPTYRPEGVLVARNLEEAWRVAAGTDLVFLAGGATLYQQALPMADCLFLTRVHGSPPGDTFFPPVDWNEWLLVERVDQAADARHAYPLSFETYRRATSPGTDSPPRTPHSVNTRLDGSPGISTT